MQYLSSVFGSGGVMSQIGQGIKGGVGEATGLFSSASDLAKTKIPRMGRGGGTMGVEAPSIWGKVGDMIGQGIGEQAMSGVHPAVRSMIKRGNEQPRKKRLGEEKEREIWNMIDEMVGRSEMGGW